jgi:hypothetical protein
LKFKKLKNNEKMIDMVILRRGILMCLQNKARPKVAPLGASLGRPLFKAPMSPA